LNGSLNLSFLVAVAVFLFPAGASAAQPAQPGDSPPPDTLAPVAVRPPSKSYGSVVARIVEPTIARKRLAVRHGTRRLSAQTAWSGQPQTLLVLRSAMDEGRQWLRVLLPTRPNGSTAWVLRDKVALGRSRYWLDVRIARRTVTVYRDGKRVRQFRAVVGAPGTPTPIGLAAVYERNRQPDAGAFLGPWALPLTAMSNVLENYGGGPGRVGIHGRSGASLQDPLGSARSHGCIRVNNQNVAWIATHVRAGTPVRIRRS
jgi:lipoprotein-anchoring transpeptidase ErfK/SrfK